MSTQAIIEEILDLSGPFTSGKARTGHRHWLEGQTTEWLLDRKKQLLQTAQRPAGQSALGLSSAQ